jgi:hypothetical protein
MLVTFREMFRADAQKRAVLPSVFDPYGARLLRECLAEAGMTPFHVADRGRYHVNLEYEDAHVFDELRGLAERVVDEPLTPLAHRWLRFSPGDYQLIRGDVVERAARGRHLELTLDFSSRETGLGEMVYSDGRDSFAIPQWPLAVALVERGDSLYRYDRYLNHTMGAVEIWRLRLSLGFAR